MQMNKKQKAANNPKTFTTRYSKDTQCIILELHDLEGLKPHIHIQHPNGRMYLLKISDDSLYIN